ncbi:OB-fold nucleic acid binding domain-containing protein [Facklamia languida]|uniref:Uncharacterized protein n=1 Tax=Facklamia languida CCUG 37842 TaxID=883113 RepID=H3NKS9_9LACT|nr:OB-fold nucleic acid binding domain-containing protein [Facklamia languida]EHR36207.1 hypothetical protein HMPREF9708_01468 [Facklamia languida CCUG 37842]
MKKCLLTVFCLLLMPLSLVKAQEGQYRPEDFDGDYGIITFLTGQTDEENRIPTDSGDMKAIMDQILVYLANTRVSDVQGLQFQSGISRLKNSFEATTRIEEGVIKSLTPGAESLQDPIISEGPSPYPIFEVDVEFTTDDYTYIVFDRKEAYLVGISGSPDSSQFLTIEVMGQADHVVLNDQIDQPLYTEFLPDGYVTNENGYQTVPYDELLQMPENTTVNVFVTGRVKKILSSSANHYKFVLEDDEEGNLYVIDWTFDQLEDLKVGDQVTVEGAYGGPTELGVPYIGSGQYDSVTIDK